MLTDRSRLPSAHRCPARGKKTFCRRIEAEVLHTFPARLGAAFAQPHALDGKRQLGWISIGKYFSGAATLDEIRRTTDAIADDTRKPRGHRLVDDEPPGFALTTRKRETIGHAVHPSQLGLIHEAAPADVDSELGRQLATLWLQRPAADDEEHRGFLQ